MLNKEKPFCLIIGETENGARFLQYGREFDANGKMIGEEVIAEDHTEPARKSGRPKKDK